MYMMYDDDRAFFHILGITLYGIIVCSIIITTLCSIAWEMQNHSAISSVKILMGYFIPGLSAGLTALAAYKLKEKAEPVS